MPDQIPTVTTSLINTNVKITWSEPADNGKPITAYKVQFLTFDGITFATNTTYCDGSDSTIMTNKYCYVPMTVFR